MTSLRVANLSSTDSTQSQVLLCVDDEHCKVYVDGKATESESQLYFCCCCYVTKKWNSVECI